MLRSFPKTKRSLDSIMEVKPLKDQTRAEMLISLALKNYNHNLIANAEHFLHLVQAMYPCKAAEELLKTIQKSKAILDLQVDNSTENIHNDQPTEQDAETESDLETVTEKEVKIETEGPKNPKQRPRPQMTQKDPEVLPKTEDQTVRNTTKQILKHVSIKSPSAPSQSSTNHEIDNLVESVKCLEIAKQAFIKKDFKKSERLLSKAKRMNPELDLEIWMKKEMMPAARTAIATGTVTGKPSDNIPKDTPKSEPLEHDEQTIVTKNRAKKQKTPEKCLLYVEGIDKTEQSEELHKQINAAKKSDNVSHPTETVDKEKSNFGIGTENYLEAAEKTFLQEHVYRATSLSVGAPCLEHTADCNTTLQGRTMVDKQINKDITKEERFLSDSVKRRVAMVIEAIKSKDYGTAEEILRKLKARKLLPRQYVDSMLIQVQEEEMMADSTPKTDINGYKLAVEHACKYIQLAEFAFLFHDFDNATSFCELAAFWHDSQSNRMMDIKILKEKFFCTQDLGNDDLLKKQHRVQHRITFIRQKLQKP